MAQQEVDSMKWASMFEKMNAQNGVGDGDGDGDHPVKVKKAKKPAKENMDEYHVPSATGEGKGSNKRLSVERIYQKKSQLEHILLRPDTYIGSVESVTQPMWVLDDDQRTMIQRDITFVPGLYKIFDEILVNAADNKQRDPKMTLIKVDIDSATGKIKIWNNGRGIPVVEHKEHNMFVPTMIFGHLLTSSNYDDTEKKVTGGRNGYGAKLCNIFSKKFVVETSYKDYNKGFKQTWTDNMGKTKEPSITEARNEDFTAVTFYPDLDKFKMESLDKDTVDLFTRRAFDIAAATKGVKVMLNGKKLPVKNFSEYIDLFVKDKVDDNGMPIKVVHEVINDRWEIAVTLSDKGFQQASFVNSIATSKGGRHVDHVADQLVTKLIDVVKKKNKGGMNIKPFQVKSHLWVFINCLIENPSFDSQTKENMTLQTKSFGSKCNMNDKFIGLVSKCGIIESILSWMKFKAQAQLNQKHKGTKSSKLKGIPKLDDANDAGTRNSSECTLILTEGDSAKSLAVAGLSVVGRDRYGVFPLRGKMLNVREATHKQILENAEVNNVIKIMGLQMKEKYDDPDKLKSLRYGKLMIMTDQDQDGSHIKGLIINFIHHFWPNLLKYNVVVEFITPIVKVVKGKEEHSFYSLPEFEEWKSQTDNWNTWKIKYYKGLGTSTAKEAKEYFSEMARHKIGFKYYGAEDDASIMLAFSKKKVEERKEWLTNWMEERKRRSEMGLPELYLYGKDTKRITYNDFINRELILFSNMDNVRSIPSLVDGFKPGQRKVIFTCLKRNLVNKEVKVAQLAGSVAELSAYHHGETSLMGTIINLAQNFVGSNNLNMLQPLGQFGTRLHGGKDAASPRYIFTMLSSLARIILNPHDEPLLKVLYDDNLKIEPEWYCPIVPMVLINGAEGIGTGWSTKIPNYDVREIVANLKRMLDGLEPEPMLPSYKHFKGTIMEVSDNRYMVNGELSVINDTTVEITELPIRSWTQNYKEEVLEPMLNGTEKVAATIQDYKEYHTDTSVRFVVKMAPEKLAQAEETGLHKLFRISNSITTTTMVLFDQNGCIKRYESVDQILQDFFDIRMEYYKKRKDYLEGMLAAESLKFDNIARFILEKIEGTVTIENKKKVDLIQMLVRRGYDSDPVKAWKDAQNKGKAIAEDLNNDEAEDESGPDFNYILSMPLWNLTKERKDELLNKKDAKAKELESLRKKSPKDLWMDNLEEFLAELDKVEQMERDDMAGSNKVDKKAAKGRARPKKVANECFPSPHGRRVVARVDSAMKIKAEKDAIKRMKAKDKKDGKDGNILDYIKMEDDDSSEPKSLADRLKLKGSPIDVLRKDDIKKEKKPRGPRQTKPKDSASPKGKKGGKKARNPWSDDSADGLEDMELSDNEVDGSFMENFIPRDKPSRRAAAKAKYTFDNDEVSDNESKASSIKSQSDYSRSKSDKVSISDSEDTEAKSDPESFKLSDNDSDSDFGPKKSKAKKGAPVKRIAAAVLDSDSDEDLDDPAPVSSKGDDDDEWLKITGQTPTTTTTDTKPVAKTDSKPIMFDSDSDAGGSDIGDKDDKDDIFQPPKPAKPAAKKPAAEKKPRAPKKAKVVDAEPMFDDHSDTDSKPVKDDRVNDELFKPVESLKPTKKVTIKRPPKEKKPAGEKKPRAPKKTGEKKDSKQPSIAAAFTKSNAAKPKSQILIDSDSDVDVASSKARGSKKASRKKKAPWEEDESDDDRPKKATKKKNPWSDSDSEDEKPQVAVSQKRPAKQMDSDVSDISDDEFVSKKQKTKARMDSDDDDFGGSDLDIAVTVKITTPRGGARSRAPVKYNFGEDDEDDDF